MASVALAKPWLYSIEPGAKAGDLAVAIDFGQTPPAAISVMEGARPFVAKLRATASCGGHTKALASSAGLTGMLKLGGCRQDGCSCQVRYEFKLAEAAAQVGDASRLSMQAGGVVLSTPSAWLLHPLEASSEQAVDLQLAPALRPHFSSGLFPSATPGHWQTSADHLHELPLSLMGALTRRLIEVPGGTVELAIEPGLTAAAETAVADWTRLAAQAVATYLGAYPVPHVLVYVRAKAGEGGVTLGDGGAVILISLANAREPKLAAKDLRSNWVMTHEMIHLALPAVQAQQHWLEEGLATYAEPVARLRAGQLSADEVFRDMVAGMPQGLPKSGDQGLDHTQTWGRTYWGGALFWLLADVELREKTAGRLGIEAALRGVQAAGGSHAVTWDTAEVLAPADQATGLHVLTKLYERQKDLADQVDLAALWRRLGVAVQDEHVVFDDQAPLAYVRQAIVLGHPPLARQPRLGR